MSLALGKQANISYSDVAGIMSGTFNLAVGKLLGAAEPAAGTIVLGVDVQISDITDSPSIDFNDLELGPVADVGNGPYSSASPGDTTAATRTACGSVPQMVDAMSAEGVTRGADAETFDMLNTTATINGCVTFTYASTDRPSQISYSDEGIDPDDPGQVDAIWETGVVPTTGTQPPSGITYSVTSDGGIIDATYSTANFGQSQDTQIAGNSWSTTIPDAGVQTPILIAQNAGNGTITCKITEDGEQIASNSAHGAYAVVTCNGS
jgi:hypothetical protein